MDLFYIIIFLLGLVVGSFLNCLIYRLEIGEGFLRGRSYCPRCKHKLGFLDLIPLFSFIWLRGRCRYCRQKISRQYPLVEISTAVIFLGIANFCPCGTSPVGRQFYLIAPFLIVIFVYDLKHYIIPDKIIYPAIVIAAIFNYPFWLSALGVAAFFMAIVLISHGKWMGAGDIKLAFLMGLILGWPNISVALFLAFLIGAIIGVGLIILGKGTMKSEIPFGPFLVMGTYFAIFWGEEIINWYAKSFYLT